MNIEFTTCVMIQNPDTGEVVVQNRKRKFIGWAFPGGHVESGESAYDCAVREVKEETELDVRNLKLCGVVHWIHQGSDDRYLCFMYKTEEYSGELISENGEGEYFWLGVNELLNSPKEKFSSVHYALSPLFHEYGKYSEVVIHWSGDEPTAVVEYK